MAAIASDAPAASSIAVADTPSVQYLLRIADTCLVLAQRLGEWCGHAPQLEEDIASANMALDLLGQARGLYARIGALEGAGHTEDQLAFLRIERDYRNVTLVELPNAMGGHGRRDFAILVVRNVIVSTFLKALWSRLSSSTDADVAAIAGKAHKEARYHQQHAGEWLVRLAGGTDESRRRVVAACDALWRYAAELFDDDAVDEAAAASGLGPRWSELRDAWVEETTGLFDEAGLAIPKDSAFRSHGKTGRHSESMGFLLSEMQHLQRAYPGGTW